MAFKSPYFIADKNRAPLLTHGRRASRRLLHFQCGGVRMLLFVPAWLWDQALWDDMLRFHLPDSPISVAEKVIRTIVVYVVLVVLLRLFGKRELAQLNPFDLVVLLLLSNSVQNAIIGSDNTVTGGIIGALTLLVLNYLVVRFMFRHRRLDEMFEGTPTVLIEKGRLHRKALAKE